MNERDKNRLRDMLDAARTAVSFNVNRAREDLETDLMFAYAVVRAIEIVGEAASQISQETREELDIIPWRTSLECVIRLSTIT